MTDETPRPESAAPARHGGAGGFAIAVIVALLVVEFVLPGFVVGIYVRATGRGAGNPSNTMIEVVFYPAVHLGRACPAIGNFYEWEVRCIAQ